jgi:hypothetical protein
MLNDEQKQLLSQMVGSEVFKAARRVALQVLSTNLDSGKNAPELAVDLAVEKGAWRAFEVLDDLCKPRMDYNPVKPRALTRNTL